MDTQTDGRGQKAAAESWPWREGVAMSGGAGSHSRGRAMGVAPRVPIQRKHRLAWNTESEDRVVKREPSAPGLETWE